ncbi:MAG: RNA polymerase sigma factor ShbA [Actinomycetia bacterium]|nr:RNA polymerase sigma factor ShbA [Actinomycetes bacterium]
MVSTDEINLAVMAARARDDDVTLNLLMREVRKVSIRYCRARLATYPGGRQLAEDVAQEICVAVLQALPTYDERGVPFEAFVYAIGSRKVADAQRSASRSRVVLVDEIPDEVDEKPGPEQQAVRAHEFDEAAGLMADLPDTLREVLLLRVALGLSAERTGDTLGMSPGAVRVAQHRALKKLRSMCAKTGATAAGGVHA